MKISKIAAIDMTFKLKKGETIMKKLLLFISTMLLFSITLLAPVATNAATCSCGNKFCVYEKETEFSAKKVLKKYVKTYLKIDQYKNFKVKFIKSDKLTGDMLRNRKQKHIIYIEITDGYVMSDKNYSGITKEGYYINYEGIDDTLPKGTKIRTYCIFDPTNNYEDDIVYRTDRVINTKKNTKQIRKAKKKFKENFGYSYDEI